MSLLFGLSRRDRDLVVATVDRLGDTTVRKLSAVLSWPERRTRLFLERIAAEPGTEIAYSALLDTVARRRSAPVAFVPVPPPVAPTGAPPPGPSLAPPPVELPRLPRSYGGGARCSHCNVPFEPTGQGNITFCPNCGALSRATIRVSAPTAANARAAGVRPDEAPATSRPTPVAADRKSQEMFAAWVTARPIPCPRCRTSLKHRGVGQYICPSCGHSVAFPHGSSSLGTPLASPPPVRLPGAR
ncbi:MAG: hypothetical protein L3K09_00680 [Thermoplasmata archaeon]|nr:hypothetical protein [Thermoplasmata archaeon]